MPSEPKITREQLKAELASGKAVKRIAEQYGVNERNLWKKKAELARQGWSPEHDMTKEVPDGFHLKGTSTLYGDDGQPKLQWVKTNIDHQRQEELMREAIEAMADDLPRLSPRKIPRQKYRKDLMACYPIGDAHIGMRSWPKETGDMWDLAEAERIQCGAMAELVERPVT